MLDVSLHRVSTDDGDCVDARITVHDAQIIGKRAELLIEQRVVVKDSRPVNGKKKLVRKAFVIQQNETVVRFPIGSIEAYTYRGKMIDIELHTLVTIDDGIIFDTKIDQAQELAISDKPPVSGDAKTLIEPEDAFNFSANLAAIPIHNRAITMLLAAIGAVVVLANTALGVHDQLVPETATYFYSHYDSDGDGQSPLVNSLGGSGLVGAGIWALMLVQLRKYMTFGFRRLPARFHLGMSFPVGRMIRGRPRVPLEDITLRVVACNMEKGQYERGSGTDRHTVSFTEPVRAVVLFEKKVDRIPARAPIAQYFPEEMSFDPMFAALFPPQVVTGNHGLAVYWEVQLLHETFVDQELVGPTEGFVYRDFFYA